MAAGWVASPLGVAWPLPANTVGRASPPEVAEQPPQRVRGSARPPQRDYSKYREHQVRSGSWIVRKLVKTKPYFRKSLMAKTISLFEKEWWKIF